MKNLWQGLQMLTRRAMIWPDPCDLLLAGSKLYLERIIRQSAASMDLPHLQVAIVVPSSEVIDKMRSDSLPGVLKREFSSHGKSVYSQLDDLDRLKAQLDDEEAAYQAADDIFPRPRWFFQPYMPSLALLGEIRVFVVNGIIFNSVVTTPKIDQPGSLHIQEPVFHTPLSRLRQVPFLQS
jgi:hypothetical protein